MNEFNINDRITFRYHFSDGHKGNFTGRVTYKMPTDNPKCTTLVVALDEPYKDYQEVLVNPWWSKAELSDTAPVSNQGHHEHVSLKDGRTIGDKITYRHKLTRETMAKSGKIEYLVNGIAGSDKISGIIVVDSEDHQEYLMNNNLIVK